MLPSVVGVVTFFLSSLAAAEVPALEGLPGQIIDKLRDNRDELVVDLLEELQGTFDWVNTQPQWEAFALPMDQVLPIPMIGDVKLHIDSLSFTQFEAAKDEDLNPIIYRTEKGYRLGLFNIGVKLSGIELVTSGFFASTHVGDLSISLEDCSLDVELIEGQEIPKVTANIGSAVYTFKSPSSMTELMLNPILMLSESMVSGTIAEAFAYYMTEFWLPIDMEYYISVAADAYMEVEGEVENVAERNIIGKNFGEIELLKISPVCESAEKREVSFRYFRPQ